MKFILSVYKPVRDVVKKKKLSEFVVKNEFVGIIGDADIFCKDTACVFFSGKIYNIEKINSLLNTNIENISELILSLYEKKGTESFRYLDGEFTFAIFTKDKKIFFRDRHGAGLQLFFTNNYVVSHQYLLHYINSFVVEPNFNNLALFLKIGYIPAPETALVGVNKLPAGNILVFHNNQFTLTDLFDYKYYNSGIEYNIDEENATYKYESLHKQAIKQRIKNTDSVQLLLSGGYDSGGNISALRDIYSGKVYTYSIGFKNNPWSELPLAKLLAEKYESEHKEYEIDGSEIEDLPLIVKHFGDPFNESGMMVNYTAMKLVSDSNVNSVILGGDGNDQHFGTAGRELALHYKYKKNGLFLVQKMVSLFHNLHAFNKDNKLFKIRFHNEKVLNILKSDSFGFREKQIEKLFLKDINIKHPKYLEPLPNSYKDFNDLFKIHNYFGDIKQVINEIILFKASKLAQKFDNHISFPYMSTDIYEFLKQLPRDLKLKGDLNTCASGKAKSKYLHKNYLYPKLPKEITERKKQGGFAPMPIFFQNDDRFKFISDTIKNSAFSKKYLNRRYLDEILETYQNEKNKPAYWFWYKQVKAFQIFNLLVLVIWWEINIEKRDINYLREL